MSNKSEVDNYPPVLAALKFQKERLDQLERHVVKLHKLCASMVTSLGDVVESVTGVEVDDRMTDIEADSDALASAGHGMDEDYGGTDERL
jgi:hypothetical protein